MAPSKSSRKFLLTVREAVTIGLFHNSTQKGKGREEVSYDQFNTV